MNAAFQRAYGTTGLLRGILIGFFLQHDHEQRLALIPRKLIKGHAEFTQEREQAVARAGNALSRLQAQVSDCALDAEQLSELFQRLDLGEFAFFEAIERGARDPEPAGDLVDRYLPHDEFHLECEL